MHQLASCCNATATFVGHHWFWLPASDASSPSLLQMFTGPCGPSLVLATGQLCEHPFLAPDVHATHATATFSKRRLLLLLLLILITGINARAYELH